jgi:methyltransferase (TIGR00027 family)
MDAVAVTGLLVAALRAEESKREDRLFDDPFAEALAGEQGRAVLERYRAAATTGTVPIIEVRTRFFDDAIARACAAGIRQFVFLAAGMDTRAYRLEWPEESTLFELDRPEVIAWKARGLAAALPRCSRVALGADLAEDWAPVLEAHRFDRRERTQWLVEGLLQYLELPLIQLIFARIDALSAPGSRVLYDIVGRSLLESPVVTGTLQMMRELGAPWLFGTDEPAELIARWNAVVTDPAVPGNAWKRWPFPAAPPLVRGVPRSYFVEGSKP